MRGWTGGRPLPLPPPYLPLPLWSGANFFSFSLPPSFSLLSLLPPLFSLLPPPLLPPPAPSPPPPAPHLPSPSYPVRPLSYFCMRISKYNESACSVTAVRLCGLPRKYQGCASFIYFLHMYRTTVPLTYIPVHSHLC